jgi:metallophosphoesterase (TIGR03768 family)
MEFRDELTLFRLIIISSMAIILFAGCSNDHDVSTPPSYPIASTVYTTLERTIVADDTNITDPLYPAARTVLPNSVADYSTYGYGQWRTEAGLDCVKRSDIMPDGYAAASASVTNAARLLHFFSMSDIHITDVQSPALFLISGLTNAGNSSAYSPVILYTTQVLDAAVQTVNALHEKQPLDFGIFLGDASNSSAYNELRWYIDVLDGQNVNPNSDPQSNYTTDYMRPFKAAGLDQSIPWYQVLGNHDHLFLGTWAQTTKTLNAYVGEDIINVGLNPSNPLDGTGFYGGVVDGSTTYGKVIYAGPEADFPTPPKVNANLDRRAVYRTGWISEFFNTRSAPMGHGFHKSGIPDACYAFEPKSNLPLKVIVLDDTETDDVAGMQGPLGFLDQTRYAWLVNELDQGQAEGKLMIIAAHIPIGQTHLWHPGSNPTESVLIAKLHTYPNLLMWISGHLHRNEVTPMPSSDMTQPELGFWMVETPSLRDFSQEFRLFDIVRNSDNTISIFVTSVDPAVREGSPAATSRSYSIAAEQLFTTPPTFPLVATASHAYNAELVKPLSPAMQTKMQMYGTPIGRNSGVVTLW